MAFTRIVMVDSPLGGHYPIYLRVLALGTFDANPRSVRLRSLSSL